jgi:hypothetical protein
MMMARRTNKMLKKLTERDFTAIIGTAQNGYTIERARYKGSRFSDSDCYGIALAVNKIGNWVTWEFKIDGDEAPDFYWGHYIPNAEDALKDYEVRS